MIKTKTIKLSLIIVIAFSVICCKKKLVNGVVLLSVFNYQQPVGDQIIYMKKGVTSDPGIPLGQYDKNVTAASNGQAYFTDLSEGDYYFYTSATSGTAVISGSITVTVVKKETPNRYEKRIYLYP